MLGSSITKTGFDTYSTNSFVLGAILLLTPQFSIRNFTESENRKESISINEISYPHFGTSSSFNAIYTKPIAEFSIFSEDFIEETSFEYDIEKLKSIDTSDWF